MLLLGLVVKVLILKRRERIAILSRLELHLLQSNFILILLNHILFNALFGQLIISVLILAFVIWVEEKMVSFGIILRGILKLLTEYGDLRLVMHVVLEESLLGMQLSPLLIGVSKSFG